MSVGLAAPQLQMMRQRHSQHYTCARTGAARIAACLHRWNVFRATPMSNICRSFHSRISLHVIFAVIRRESRTRQGRPEKISLWPKAQGFCALKVEIREPEIEIIMSH